MFALFFTGFMVVNGPAPSPDLNPPDRELAQVLEQARCDFESRYDELGLVGAAPLALQEPARAATPDLVPQRRVEWLDAEAPKPHTAHARAAQRPSR